MTVLAIVIGQIVDTAELLRRYAERSMQLADGSDVPAIAERLKKLAADYLNRADQLSKPQAAARRMPAQTPFRWTTD